MTRLKAGLIITIVSVIALCVSGCTTYMGVSRSGDHVYLTGVTSFIIFSSSWVKKCSEHRNSMLVCQELAVADGRLGSAGRSTSEESYRPVPRQAADPDAPDESGDSITPTGTSGVTSDAQCRVLPICKQLGRCRAVAGKCVR